MVTTPEGNLDRSNSSRWDSPLGPDTEVVRASTNKPPGVSLLTQLPEHRRLRRILPCHTSDVGTSHVVSRSSGPPVPGVGDLVVLTGMTS